MVVVGGAREEGGGEGEGGGRRDGERWYQHSARLLQLHFPKATEPSSLRCLTHSSPQGGVVFYLHNNFKLNAAEKEERRGAEERGGGVKGGKVKE